MKKIAIPTSQGNLSAHFGHCEKFAIFEVEGNEIIKEDFIIPPPHEPGSHPAFLRELGCSTIIAGGMGLKAQNLFEQNNIEVFIGVPSLSLRELVKSYLNKDLESGDNLCSH